MNSSIKKYLFLGWCISLWLVVGSCGGHGSNEQLSHEPETKEQQHGHEEQALEMVASLTKQQMQAVGIVLAKVENKELSETIKANGLLRVPNNNKASVSTLFGGVIDKLNVQIGDYVNKGDVIAIISNSAFIEPQEAYLSVSSQITFARQEVERQIALNQGNAGAKKNLQSAEATLEALIAKKASLAKQLSLMGINPNTLSTQNLRSSIAVQSPLSGSVSELIAKIGSFVDPSLPVAEIVDNRSLHLDLQVFEKDLPKIKIGQTIHFTLTNNPTHEYDAKIFSIGSSFENDSKTIAVHASVIGAKQGLIDGMNITGIVSLSNRTTPAVPDEAIVSSQGKYYVFVVTDKKPEMHEEDHVDGSHKKDAHLKNEEAKGSLNFEKIEVLKGTSDMGYTAVNFIQDLAENAQVVTKGAYFINAKLTNSGEHEH